MKSDLDALISRACLTPGREGLREVVAKELLHYDILFSLQREGLLDGLVFQGGTLLRLCHGSNRFSEDLDFMGGPEFEARQMQEISRCLTLHIGARYGLDVTVKAPRDVALEGVDGVSVSRWEMRVSPTPGRPDLPKQCIKIEVCNLAARASELVEMQCNYDFLPDAYRGLLLQAEPMAEVMADKLVSLPACTRYIRHRDIWDLGFMAGKGVTVDADLVKAKVQDYGVVDFSEKLEARIDNLHGIISGDGFQAQMSRFLPADVLDRSLRRNGFNDFLTSRVQGLLIKAREALMEQEYSSPGFDM